MFFTNPAKQANKSRSQGAKRYNFKVIIIIRLRIYNYEITAYKFECFDFLCNKVPPLSEEITKNSFIYFLKL